MGKSVTIDGNNFSDLSGFLDEVEKVLAPALGRQFGRNMNAFNDVLRGGFGVHEYEEGLDFTWMNGNKSREDLGNALFDDIIGIIKGHDHVNLILQ